MDSLGNILWGKDYVVNSHQVGYSLQQTLDGGYVICGYRSDSLLGTKDILVMKTDEVGNTLWEKTFGGEFSDIGYCVRQTQKGGYIVTGTMASLLYSVEQSDVCLIRIDSLGNILWTGFYGSRAKDEGHSVRETEDGGYVIAGLWSIRVGEEDAYLVLTDSLGNLLFERKYGEKPSDASYSGQQTSDRGYVLAGYTSSFGAGGKDIHIIKTDSLGTRTWDATYGGPGEDIGHSAEQTSDGGYVVVGQTSRLGSDDVDLCLVKVDSLGNTVWERTFGGGLPDVGYSVRQTADGGYIAVGKTRSLGLGANDNYLIKTDENGLTGTEESSASSDLHLTTFRLQQNSPNPFQHLTLIVYSLPHAAQITLAIYDITGRLVETVVNETQQPDIHQVQWNRKSNPSGVYFYSLRACPESSPEPGEGRSRRAREFVETREMVVVE